MARIKIEDLPEEKTLTKEEIRKVTGGATYYLTQSLLDQRAETLKESGIDRYILPNMMHDAGP